MTKIKNEVNAPQQSPHARKENFTLFQYNYVDVHELKVTLIYRNIHVYIALTTLQ